jgi:hypothetical protein
MHATRPRRPLGSETGKFQCRVSSLILYQKVRPVIKRRAQGFQTSRQDGATDSRVSMSVPCVEIQALNSVVRQPEQNCLAVFPSLINVNVRIPPDTLRFMRREAKDWRYSYTSRARESSVRFGESLRFERARHAKSVRPVGEWGIEIDTRESGQEVETDPRTCSNHHRNTLSRILL